MKILLLEDDANLGFILKEHLEMKEFDVKLSTNGVEGMIEYNKANYNICLVDVMMPKKDGFTFVKEVRQKDQKIPIIFLTAKSLKEDRITGFKVGCDDYITKPFSMEELLLRIQAVLRRSVNGLENEVLIQFKIGRYFFDSINQTLQIGKQVEFLTTKESELLHLLCLNMNRVLDRNEALTKIWGSDSYFSARSMDVFISKIRKCLAEDSRISIVNVHGRGFKLVVNS